MPFLTFHSGKSAPSLSTRQALESAHRWSRLFRAHGVRRGDRVVLLMPTGPAFVGALLGAMLCGAAAVPLASPLTFGSVEPFVRNLQRVLTNAEPRVVVTYSRFVEVLRGSTQFDVLMEADLDLGATDVGSPPSVSSSDTALIQYTSGTTGSPKGVVISHRALVSNAYAIANALGITERDVGVSWLPMFHDMGLVGVLLTSVCHPYRVHLASPEWFAMGPDRWMDLVGRVSGTLTAAPNFAYDMCAARASRLRDTRLDTLRVALNGAEPVLASTVRKFRDQLAPFGFRGEAMLPVYGMAECTLAVTFPEVGTPVAALSVDRDALERGEVSIAVERGAEVVSVGQPVAGTSVAVVTNHGRVGTIHVASASIMDGYFRDEDASNAALKDGWLTTGDLGFIDEGRLFVTGRAKDVIIQGGRNIYPYDLERVAVEAGRLRAGAALAFGKRNEARGTEDIVLVAETAEQDTTKRDTLMRTIRGEILATLGVRVDEVQLWPIGAVPKTTSGKAKRRECAALFLSRRG